MIHERPTYRHRTAITTVTAILMLAAVIVLPVGSALAQSPINNWVPDGPVYTSVKSGLNFYVGGKFTQVGPPVGNAVSIDAATGAVDPRYGRVTGTVYAVEPDGSGGWYIGGQFTSAQSQPITNLGHIGADGNLTGWRPTPGGPVYDIAVLNGVVYIGGSFGVADGVVRNNLAAYDATTGALTSWNPNADGPVTEVETSSTKIYVGGTFHFISGQPRYCLAEINPGAGGVTNFFQGASQVVNATAVKVSNDVLYISVTFDFGGGVINYITKSYDLVPLTARPYNLDTNAPVQDIAADNNTGLVYLGGDFTTVSSTARSHVACISGAIGTLTPWAPSVSGSVLTVDLGAGGLVVGGNFASVNGTARKNIASLDLATGSVLAWDPSAAGQVNAVATDGSWIRAGGTFPIMGGVARSNLFSMDYFSQAILPWNPGTNDAVYAICANNDTIYVGGLFTTLAGTTRNRIGAVHRDTGALYAFNPNVTLSTVPPPVAYVHAIAKSRNIVYFGGLFTHVGGVARFSLAAIDATTNTLMPWNPDCSGAVLAMGLAEPAAPAPIHVVVGGDFDFVGGGLRYRIASLNGTTGAAEPFNPNPTGPVNALIVEPTAAGDIQNVIFAGNFTAIDILGTTPAPYLARWPTMFTSVPAANAQIRAMRRDGSLLYIGGDFTAIGGSPRSHLARLNISGSAPSVGLYNPSLAGGDVYTVETDGGYVYAGGSHLTVNGLPNPYFTGIYQFLTGVDSPAPPVPSAVRVHAAPNPFGEGTAIRFTLESSARTRVHLYDAQGRLVRRLHDDVLPAGRHAVAWNGRDDRDRVVGSGVYFAEVTAGERRSVSKLYRMK